MKQDAVSPADVPEGAHVEKAGAFDIRRFIGALVGIYGVILIVLGLVAFTPEAAAKTDGFNANLWVGLGMFATGVVFFIWAGLRPIRIIVPDQDPGGQ